MEFGNMRHSFSGRPISKALFSLSAFALITLMTIGHATPQKARTETSTGLDAQGNSVKIETDYDDQKRVIEKREFDKSGKLHQRSHYTYLEGFKKPNITVTVYQSDGDTPQTRISVDHDKDGNQTSNVTNNFDKDGKETGGTKRERDPTTGKEHCYNWNPAKQEYEETTCPPAQKTEPSRPPDPGEAVLLIDEPGQSSTPTPTPKKSGDNTMKKGTKVSYSAGSEVANGLVVTTFTTPQGKIKVNLTDDVAAGDTITGTVQAEPNGSNDNERAQNQAELNGYVIGLGGQKTRVGEKKISCHVPTTLTSDAKTIVL